MGSLGFRMNSKGEKTGVWEDCFYEVHERSLEEGWCGEVFPGDFCLS
jgi:hypothetical protein